jgi:putative transcriptional regulator
MLKTKRSKRPGARETRREARRADIKAAPRKSTPVGRAVLAGLKEAVAHARGEITLPTREYEVPGPVDVKAIRSKLGLSQSGFSNRYGFSVRTLQDWELGRTKPPSAARAYLIVIDRYPDTVEKALLGAA